MHRDARATRARARTHVKPFDSFVSASTSSWQFVHHGSAGMTAAIVADARSRGVRRGAVRSWLFFSLAGPRPPDAAFETREAGCFEP
jgi:hypothetical protein|eukprot:28787-Pelagococcus_subviridis.AAC.3